MTQYNIRISVDKNSLAIDASDLISQKIQSSLNQKDRVKVALCGGSTPKAAYSLLGKKNLEWSRVDLFLGDERWVSQESNDSNCHLLKSSLFLKGNPSSKASFFGVSTIELSSPEISAKEYEKVIKENVSGTPPKFDLILLGLGDDGHTASLFPGSEVLFERANYIAVGEGKGHKRITFTSKLINSAKEVLFLVSGASKQLALKRLIDKTESWERTPAKLVESNTEIIVLTDQEAYNYA